MSTGLLTSRVVDYLHGLIARAVAAAGDPPHPPHHDRDRPAAPQPEDRLGEHGGRCERERGLAPARGFCRAVGRPGRFSHACHALVAPPREFVSRVARPRNGVSHSTVAPRSRNDTHPASAAHESPPSERPVRPRRCSRSARAPARTPSSTNAPLRRAPNSRSRDRRSWDARAHLRSRAARRRPAPAGCRARERADIYEMRQRHASARSPRSAALSVSKAALTRGLAARWRGAAPR